MGAACGRQHRPDPGDEVQQHEHEASEIQIGHAYQNPMSAAARRATTTELGPAGLEVGGAESHHFEFINQQLLAKVAQLQAANAALQVVVKLSRATKEQHAAAAKIQAGFRGHSVRKFAAVLHPKLAAFTPLSLAAGPAQLLTKNTMEKTSRRKMLQTAVQADPTNLDAHAALEAYADELSSSFATEVESRLSADSIKATMESCMDVIRIGNQGFHSVYTSVWGMVEAGESDGVAAYAIAMNELDSLVVPVADQPHSHMCGGRFAQRPEARRVVVLYADACTAKPGFDAELLELERRCKSAGVEMGQMIVPQNPKDIARMIEKTILVPGQKKVPKASEVTAQTVTDVLRGMAVANSMHDVAAVLRHLAQMVRDGRIVVVRLKCRFLAKPSDGGWRDVLINFYVTSDPLKHIGELQVGHSQLSNARKGLPGHIIYARVRNGVEMVLMTFGDQVGSAILGVLHKIVSLNAQGHQQGITFEEARSMAVAACTAVATWQPAKQQLFPVHIEALAMQLNFANGIGYAPGRYDEQLPWFNGTDGTLVADNDFGGPAKNWSTITEVGPDGVKDISLEWQSRIPLLPSRSHDHYHHGRESEHQKRHHEYMKKNEDDRIARHNRSLAGTITCIPLSFAPLLQALTKLTMYGCHALIELPENIGKLSSLETLLLSHAPLKQLPDSIGELRSLKVLFLGYLGSIETLPSTLGSLATLTELKIVECDALTAVPDSLSNLVALETFKCWHSTRVEQLPASFAGMKALRKADFTGCRSLTALPDCTGCRFNELDVNRCTSLDVLPDWIADASNGIKAFDCTRLQIKTLPASFGSSWSTLEELSVDMCAAVTDLPKSLLSLVGLKMLDASNTSLSELPSWIGGMAALESLVLRQCVLLAHLPDELSSMPSLATLEICNCPALHALPTSLGSAAALETLIVRNCGNAEAPAELPGSLATSTTLAKLNYYNSDVPACVGPAWIADLPNLAELFLYHSHNAELLDKLSERGVAVGHFSAPRRACRT